MAFDKRSINSIACCDRSGLSTGRSTGRCRHSNCLGVGRVYGTLLAALLAERLNRRSTYFGLCLGSLVIVPGFYLTQTDVNSTFLVLVFVMGAFTASFYGWLPLFLPEIFRTAVRATAQGFAFNFGRILAAIGVLQLGSLTSFSPMVCRWPVHH